MLESEADAREIVRQGDYEIVDENTEPLNALFEIDGAEVVVEAAGGKS